MARTKKSVEQRSELNRIHNLADIVALCRTYPQGKKFFAKVLPLIKEMLYFDAATLYLFNQEKEQLEEVASLGGKVELLSFLSVGAGEGLSGWTAYNKKPLLLSERTTVSSFDPDKEYATFLSLPLLDGDDAIGVLNLGCTEVRAFTDNDVKLLTIIADQLALCIDRVKYQEKTETLHLQLQKTCEQLRHVQATIPDMSCLSKVASLVSAVNHGINNALAVVVGNVECLLSEKSPSNQKELSRLKRIESAALQIASYNSQVLDINSLVQKTLSSVGSTCEFVSDSVGNEDV